MLLIITTAQPATSYVLSSFLSVALGHTLGTAMTGRSKGRQELADQTIPPTYRPTGAGSADFAFSCSMAVSMSASSEYLK
jgi:RNA repair, ligase-Pnkp-associating, region of Hen1